jgi:hypothetical protein
MSSKACHDHSIKFLERGCACFGEVELTLLLYVLAEAAWQPEANGGVIQDAGNPEVADNGLKAKLGWQCRILSFPGSPRPASACFSLVAIASYSWRGCGSINTCR